MADEEPFIKVIVVGEQGVGKTCLLNQYCYGKFDNTTPPTIGCDFTMKITKYKGKTIRLQLWDIAGQERYKSVSKLYVRGALGCIIVSDIMDENSLAESLKWKQLVSEHCDQVDGKGIPMIIVQNKVDEVKMMGKLESFQTEQSLQKYAKENGFQGFAQTSAKDNINLTEIFDNIVKLVVDSGLLNSVKSNNFSSNKQPQKGGKQEQDKKIVINTQENSNKSQKQGGCC